MFKRWMAGLLAVLALVACGTPAAQAVARVDNVTLTRQELDQRIDRILGQGADRAEAIARPIVDRVYDITGMIRSRRG